jgi:hypothetical protein
MGGPAGDSLDEAAYATLIEEAFIAERGTPFLLSAKDWQLIRGWREGGVPVDTVVRAVHETFEKRRVRGRTGKISSISYCAGAVEERWEMERRGLVGQSVAGHAPAPGARGTGEILTALAERLRAARGVPVAGVDGEVLRKGLEAAAAKIDGIAPDKPVDECEEKLTAAEASLVKAVLRGLGPEPLAVVEARVAEGLGDVTGVSGDVVDRMRRALTRREVRRILGLPPLTLLEG